MTVLTCGDAAAGQLREAGLADDVIVWRDILHEGPVPGTVGPDELCAVRAGYLASQGWAIEAEARQDFLDRNQRLRGRAEDGPLNLWFDDNLVNQLQLIQVLALLSTVDIKEVWLAGPHSFGGVPPRELRDLDARKQPLTPVHLDLGTTAWAAFTAGRPDRLAALAAAPTEPLPALGPALTRQLRQYPGARDGLGLTERRALRAVAAGRTRFAEIFAAHAADDDPPFLGDTTLRGYLARLAGGPYPLLEIDGKDYRLTPTGREILGDAGDQIERNGIDRWYGGVHLHGSATWRWDDERGALVG